MIRDANGPYLAAALRRLGIEDTPTYRVGDNPSDLQQCIAELEQGTDLILTTGGVSAGRMDFVPAVLAELGAESLIRKRHRQYAHRRNRLDFDQPRDSVNQHAGFAAAGTGNDQNGFSRRGNCFPLCVV